MPHYFFLSSTLRQNRGKDRENVCGIWFKIGSAARSHWTQGMWRFERSREKRYITACELSVTRLPHERYRLAGRRFYTLQLYTVTILHTQLDTAQPYMVTTRHRRTLHVHNSIQHNSTRYNSTRHNSTRPQLDTPQLYTDHMAVTLKLL